VTKRQWWYLAAINALVVAGLGFGAYAFGTRKASSKPFIVRFDTTAWLVVVTALLALVTGVMAYETRKTARAAVRDIEQGQSLLRETQRQSDTARRQVDLSQDALNAAALPLLTDVGDRDVRTGHLQFKNGFSIHTDNLDGVHIFRDNSNILCSITLRNLGAGTAIVRGLGLGFGSVAGWPGDRTVGIVATGELTRFMFVIPGDREDVSQEDRQLLIDGNATLRVDYTDVYGRQMIISKAHISKAQVQGGRLLTVKQVGFFRPGEDEPFAMS
jgi:hypothetical protein